MLMQHSSPFRRLFIFDITIGMITLTKGTFEWVVVSSCNRLRYVMGTRMENRGPLEGDII